MINRFLSRPWSTIFHCNSKNIEIEINFVTYVLSSFFYNCHPSLPTCLCLSPSFLLLSLSLSPFLPSFFSLSLSLSLPRSPPPPSLSFARLLSFSLSLSRSLALVLSFFILWPLLVSLSVTPGALWLIAKANLVIHPDFINKAGETPVWVHLVSKVTGHHNFSVGCTTYSEELESDHIRVNEVFAYTWRASNPERYLQVMLLDMFTVHWAFNQRLNLMPILLKTHILSWWNRMPRWWTLQAHR